MKVGYIIASKAPLFSPIGYSVHIRSFIDNFVKIGGKIFLIRKAGDKNKLRNIEIYNLKWPVGPLKLQKLCDFFFNLKLYQTGQKIIKIEKPDIIHEREMYLNFSGLLLAKKLNIPYVLEVNSIMMYEVRNSFPVYRKIHRIIEKKLYAESDGIIAVSDAIKNHLVSRGVPEEKIKVIPNGVDENIFNPSLSGQDVRKKYGLGKKHVIGFGGSLHQEWQGIDDLLKAARAISSIERSVVFLIIGGTEAEIKKFQNIAPENVLFTGQVEHKKMPAYLAAADILAAPYKKEKGLKDIGFYNSPIKLFEYMAMGKPVITSNIGQISEIIRHKQTGVLVEPGNDKDLTENILSLIEDDRLKRELGYNARDEVKKKYTWKQNAQRTMEVYREILEKSRQSLFSN